MSDAAGGQRRALGIAAAVLAAVIGSSWQIASRHAVTTSLDPLSLALLRYVVPTLLLMPLVLRTGLRPAGVPAWKVMALVAGGGLPFVLVGLTGARHAPVAHMGVLLASVMPVFTTALSFAVYREAVAPVRLAGFALIGLGVVLLGRATLATVAAGTALGDALFLVAALLWAVYSVAFRASGLTPWQGVAVVNAWSALLVLPLYLLWGSGSLAAAPWGDLLLQTVMQGLVAGVFGLATYSIAIRHLGPAPAAAFAALVPVLSTLGGALVLKEVPATTTLVAAGLAALGVLLASGMLGRKRGAPTAR